MCSCNHCYISKTADDKWKIFLHALDKQNYMSLGIIYSLNQQFHNLIQNINNAEMQVYNMIVQKIMTCTYVYRKRKV